LDKRWVLVGHYYPAPVTGVGFLQSLRMSVCPAGACPELFTMMPFMDFHNIAHKTGVQVSPDIPFFRFFIFVKMAVWF
jgi:hypothetical protein